MNESADGAEDFNGWLDPEDYPWCAGLEARSGEILEELHGVLDQEAWVPWGDRHGMEYTPSFTLMRESKLREFAQDGQERIGSGDAPNWRLFGIYLKGRPLPRGCALCPRTAAAVKRIPRMVNAGFSCFEAGYRLQLHRGYDETLYRTHLGLVVPSGDCALRLGGETRRWTAGKTLMFDDTHPHEAWNLTGEHRFVLIVDTLNHNRFWSGG